MISAFPLAANSGMKSATLSCSRNWPRSTRIITLVAVAIGLVSDAMSNSVSVVIGTAAGSNCRLPYARSNTMPARRPIKHHATRHLALRDGAVYCRVDQRPHAGIHVLRRRLVRSRRSKLPTSPRRCEV